MNIRPFLFCLCFALPAWSQELPLNAAPEFVPEPVASVELPGVFDAAETLSAADAQPLSVSTAPVMQTVIVGTQMESMTGPVEALSLQADVSADAADTAVQATAPAPDLSAANSALPEINPVDYPPALRGSISLRSERLAPAEGKQAGS